VETPKKKSFRQILREHGFSLSEEAQAACGILAVPGDYTFMPEDCEDDYLIGFVEGRYDSINAGNDKLVAKEKEQAREELRRRGSLK